MVVALESTIEAKRDRIVQDFANITTQDEKYRYIIQKGRDFNPLKAELKLEKFLIEGCMSQAWLVPEFRDDRLYFHLDSDAAIVKGIMAILCEVYSGNTPAENLSFNPDFLQSAGITEHLSMNRRNGLANVLKQIKLYSLAYQALGTR